MADAELTEARLSLRRAKEGLPERCAISGGAAHGAVTMKTPRSSRHPRTHAIRVPLSEAVFTRWTKRERLHIRARWFASLLTAAAIVVVTRSTGPGLAILGLAVGVHLVDLWARRQSDRLRPSLARDGDDVVFGGVHPEFARALEAIG